MNLHWQDQYKKLGFKAQRLYPNEELLRFLEGNYFHLSRPERKKIRILELGCGSGANLWMIAKEGFCVYGIDIAKKGLELCSIMLKHWHASAKLKLGDMTDLPCKDNYYDAVVDIVSMQHLTFAQHIKAYAEVKRILKPGGILFSYHLGNKSYSYKNGGGRKIDKYTLDNIANPKAPLANNGITCFPTEKAVERVLGSLNYKNICIENVLKTYNNRSIALQYLVIKASK